MEENVLPPKDGDQAQESDTQEGNNSKDISGPEEFDIQEGEILWIDMDVDVEQGGTVEPWKSLEALEKRLYTSLCNW